MVDNTSGGTGGCPGRPVQRVALAFLRAGVRAGERATGMFPCREWQWAPRK